MLALYTTLLVSNRALSLGDIAETLGCSKQVVRRLLFQIESSRFGKVHKEMQGKEAFFRLDKPSPRPGIAVNAQGLRELALCREFLLRLLPPGMHKQMQNSLSQASAYLEKDSEVVLGGLGGSLGKGEIDYSNHEAILARFMNAISSRRVCQVTYKTRRSAPEKTWAFAPLRLLAYHESIHIIGYRVTEEGPVAAVYEKPVHLALHRVINCEVTRRSSKNLPEPETEKGALGIMAGEPFAVTARFSPQAATYAAERKWSAGQKVEDLPDGGVLLHITASNPEECVAWILGFGDDAEILAPDWLRAKTAEEIRNMARLYA